MKQHCQKCTMNFTVGMPIGSKHTGRVVCPDCGISFHDGSRKQKGRKYSTEPVRVWIDGPSNELSPGEWQFTKVRSNG